MDVLVQLLLLGSALVTFLLTSVYSGFSFSELAKFRCADQEKVLEITAPRHNIWAELPEDDARDVYGFVAKGLPELRLSGLGRDSSGEDVNYIFSVERLQPNKTDAVSYLYSDGSEPLEWAKVAIAQTIDNSPCMAFYMVGPLPVSEETKILPMDYAFSNGKSYVKTPVRDFFKLFPTVNRFAPALSDITQELLGARLDLEDPENPNGILMFPRASLDEFGRLLIWAEFFRFGSETSNVWLLPQGLYAKINATSNSVDDWSLGELLYNGILYENADALRAAIKSPEFVRAPRNLDGAWALTEDFDARPEGRELPPPIAVQPQGRRYKLDRQQRYVSWFGFEFYLSTTHTTGVSLWDIRFQGERIMYELGLQEALAHYADNDPKQGAQLFMDSHPGMGRSMYELVPGYDCPAYADYLDFSWNQEREFHRVPNSICIFEYTADAPLTRHTAANYVTASRNTYLVVRFISTVGNYDYTFSYQFYMDGSIEVKVQASGFISPAFFSNNSTQEQDEYGYRIHDALSSTMHDHVINFKADLDVAGGANEMVKLSIEPLTRSYPWDQPEFGDRNTMHLAETAIDEETGLNWPANAGSAYIVYNAEKKNAWGERRGYRIMSGSGMGNTAHLTIPNSTALGEAARWAEKDLWVVRQKDTEPRSADPMNWFSIQEPLVDFSTIANRESLLRGSQYDGDLVVYFNLGNHHVPHSGDLPNTLMHTSASSVMFMPHNFWDRDASRESVQGVRLELTSDKIAAMGGRPARSGGQHRPQARYFGTPYHAGMKMPLEAFEPDLENAYGST